MVKRGQIIWKMKIEIYFDISLAIGPNIVAIGCDNVLNVLMIGLVVIIWCILLWRLEFGGYCASGA